MSTHSISFTLNGDSVVVETDARTSLADLLRDTLGLTGTNLGCEHGVCGTCTVLIDGMTVRSCLTLAVQADGRTVTTVEGLADGDGNLHPVQKAFAENHALQCGFCTPGFLLSSIEILAEGEVLDGKSVRERLSGNLCRCTGYHNIVAAVTSLLEADR